MALHHNPRIVTSGLELALDAADKSCYPGTGIDLTDLSENSYIFRMLNGPTYTSEAGGTISFDGTNDYIRANGIDNDLFAWTPDGSIGDAYATYEVWVKTSDSVGFILSKPWNGNGEYNLQIHPQFVRAQVGNQSKITYYTAQISTGEWAHIVYWISPTTHGYYINGDQQINSVPHGITNTSPANGNSKLPLTWMTLYPYGTWAGNTSHAMEGLSPILRKYTRALTAEEVLQNYNATKTRFGL